jgi:hypothetical protein
MWLKKIFIVLLILQCMAIFAQHQVTLLNGKIIEGRIDSITPSEIKMYTSTKSSKPLYIERYRAFSVNLNGQDSVIYIQDSLYGNTLSAEQMQFFVWGEQDAMKGYKPYVSSSIGFALGAAAGYFMVHEQAFLPIVVPVLYVPLQLIPKVKVNKKYVRDLSYLYQEDYLFGYERVARNRKVQRSFWYSMAGLVAGFVITSVAQ